MLTCDLNDSGDILSEHLPNNQIQLFISSVGSRGRPRSYHLKRFEDSRRYMKHRNQHWIRVVLAGLEIHYLSN